MIVCMAKTVKVRDVRSKEDVSLSVSDDYYLLYTMLERILEELRKNG